MRCPECGSEKVVKDGKQRGKQTYLCKVCLRRFTPNATKLHRPSHVKQRAIELYINGMSINAISKVLNIPYMTVWMWIWSVVVELSDGSIKKFLFAGDRSLGTFLKDIGKVARS